MDLKKFEDAFDSMNYDLKNKLKINLQGLCASVIVTESADLETASDFIAALLDSEDTKILNTVLIQESLSKNFTDLLVKKVKTYPANDEITKLSGNGFEVIGNRIVKCTRSMINDEKSSTISMEIFRTTKEAIGLSKSAVSVGLWCDKLSIVFEYVNALGAQQIWLNSSFGTVNSKIPFLSSNEVVCDDCLKKSIADGSQQNALFEVTGNVQFQTTFQNSKFKSVVIPFGETFAN
ncbi:unnamed protein product [Chironomus riparius]|uniref:Uncharacterized protein n=1 Tax=Chironomus riparius TaxID=315576 RepID=A0A9N9WTD9_9DIPT|nr:unnamed protein product [Chironomus riparius]